MSGIQEFQSPASIVGNISISAPNVGDAHAPALGDFGSLGMGYNGATWDRLRVDANKNLKVLSKGGNVELIATIFNSLAITTTAIQLSTSNIDVSSYKDLLLLVTNSLDQPLVVNFYWGGTTIILTDASGADLNFNIPKRLFINRYQIINKTDLPRIFDASLFYLQIGLSAAIAPTTGSVTMYLYGTPR